MADMNMKLDNNEPRWISPLEAARLLGMSERTIRRRIADGTIRAQRFGPRLIRVDATRLEEMARPVAPGGYGTL